MMSLLRFAVLIETRTDREQAVLLHIAQAVDNAANSRKRANIAPAPNAMWQETGEMELQPKFTDRWQPKLERIKPEVRMEHLVHHSRVLRPNDTEVLPSWDKGHTNSTRRPIHLAEKREGRYRPSWM
jgi:hypothetical protein